MVDLILAWAQAILILPLIAGEVTATEALRDACQSLKEVCLHVKQTFKDANVEFDSSKTQNMET